MAVVDLVVTRIVHELRVVQEMWLAVVVVVVLVVLAPRRILVRTRLVGEVAVVGLKGMARENVKLLPVTDVVRRVTLDLSALKGETPGWNGCNDG